MTRDAGLKRAQVAAFAAAAAAFLAGGLAVASNPATFLRGYLLGFHFWLGIALGSLGILLLHGLVGGNWGRVVRGPLASAASTLPIMALLFIPIAVGLRTLYPWAAPGAEADEVLLHKRAYLNPPFFIVRAIVYLVVWAAMSAAVIRNLRRERSDGEDPDGRKDRILSGVGLVVFVLTGTFAAVDWIMSLEPHWFSAGFGLALISGHGLSSLALGIAATALLARPAVDTRAAHLHDLGNLLLAFLMIWSYLSFSQYLIIWSGNLPEETSWYLHRIEGGWQVAAVALIVLHFAVPFLVLLSVRAKRHPRLLVGVAGGLLLMRAFEAYWLIVPSFSPKSISLHWLDLTGLVGIGGIWAGLWLRTFRRGAADLSIWPPAREHAHA